jgi:ribosomal protein S18 acetylase RimI-like enzyme
MFDIYPIAVDSLVDLKPLLDRSAGYEVTLQDEVEYFQRLTNSNGFYARTANGRVAGFVRSFQFEPTWSLIEFYVDPDFGYRKLLAYELFQKFQGQLNLKTDHRWRVDILHSDTEMNEVIQALEFADEVKIFRYFNLDLGTVKMMNQPAGIVKSADPMDVAEVLSFLSPVSEYDAQMWMNDDQIRILKIKNDVVCAAQVFINDDCAEIVRISTNPQFKSQGYGSKLIAEFIQELVFKKIPRLFLKVEDKNETAVGFYKKLGFQENTSLRQYWYSKTV